MTRRTHSRGVVAAGLGLVVGLATLAALLFAGFYSGSASAVDLPPVARQMRAFHAPPLPESAVPPQVRIGLQRLPDATTQGAPRFDQVRLLRGGLGANRAGLYAVPTSGGVVCMLVNERTYFGTCASQFSRAQGNLAVNLYFGEGVPFTVAGLASDDVAAVTVVLHGVASRATLRNNVFFWQSDSPSITRADLDGLRATQADGTVVTVDTP